MNVRRTIALLLVVLLEFAAGAAVFAPSDARGACTDHLCQCAARRPPAADLPCHEHAGASGYLLEHAGCHHGGTATLPSVRPHLLPPPVAVANTLATAEPALAVAGRIAPGFLDIDLPPPRARA